MSEEAINDILVQTELDPDFQGLYDLFACGKYWADMAKTMLILELEHRNLDAYFIGTA